VVLKFRSCTSPWIAQGESFQRKFPKYMYHPPKSLGFCAINGLEKKEMIRNAQSFFTDQKSEKVVSLYQGFLFNVQFTFVIGYLIRRTQIKD
jgi:hypothetical protein